MGYSGNQWTPLADRVWGRVATGPGCWIWMGAKGTRGYGKIVSNKHTLKAHRVVWELLYGPVPDGLEICHRCDNPPCVRPDHLFVGTHTDNMRDMFAKDRRKVTPAVGRGRHALGEQHWNSKLTPELVRSIRTRVAAGEPQNIVAANLGLSTGCISGVVHRRTWRHVA